MLLPLPYLILLIQLVQFVVLGFLIFKSDSQSIERQIVESMEEELRTSHQGGKRPNRFKNRRSQRKSHPSHPSHQSHQTHQPNIKKNDDRSVTFS